MVTLTPESTQIVTKEVNVALEFVNGIFPRIPLEKIVRFISAYNLDPSGIAEKLYGDNGRMHVQIATDIYFVMSWYRLESGSFEIVCYATSNYDDLRVPFTTVYGSNERNSRKRRLNANMSNLPTYFNGKGHAFACIEAHIKAAGFCNYEFQDLSLTAATGSEGRLTADISNNVFVTVTWYKMPSGNYEIIVYAS
jgi:hypothetical protein